MNAIQVARHRKMLGQSVDQLAADIGVSPATLVAWEAGQRQIPTKYARQLEWLAAAAEREAALAGSGLPECEWVKNWAVGGPPSDPTLHLERLQALEKHSADCAVCQARAGYVQTKLPAMPEFPMGWGMRLFGGVVDTYERIHGWRRPVAIALLVPLLLSVASLVRFAPRAVPFEILTYLVALSVAATCGIGLYHGLRLLHGSAIGRWVARSVAGVTAMVAFGAAFMLAGFSGAFSRSGEPLSWGEIVVLGAAIGLAYAALWPLVSAVQARRD